MIPQRKKSNSSKVNLIISAVFHSILIGLIFYFAAKEGLLGKKFQKIAVQMVKEKKPEPPKQKPEEPKPEQPKQEAKANIPQPKVVTAAPPPPAAVAAEAAPAAVALPSFAFDDGAIQVKALDQMSAYKDLIEHTLHSYWNRPEDESDDNYSAKVQLTIDPKSGYVEDSQWVSGSGDPRWDQTVKEAVAQLKTIGKQPPKNFPSTFVVRFDVASENAGGIEFGSQ